MENICNYSFTCFISTCSCVTEYSFPFTESQQCNVTCNAWSFQREPPDPEPEEDFMLSADQTFKIHLITEFEHILRPNSCPQQLFTYICYVLLFFMMMSLAIIVFIMLSLCYYCFHDVVSMLSVFSWCYFTSSWLFFRPPQREEQRSSSQPNLMDYRFIEGGVYVFCHEQEISLSMNTLWLKKNELISP